MKNFKFLVVGLGSIGERHVRNLIHLGIRDISVFRRSVRHPRTLTGDEFKTFTDWQSALDDKPQVVIIANPTAMHVPFAIDAARRGIHLLIEKPLSNSFKGVVELRELIAHKCLASLVGYNLRFHPCVLKAKEIVEYGKIGEPLSARAEFGKYLPDFHPWEDYRNGYAAREELGGGVLLTNSHEIDCLYWLFGPVKKVSCVAKKLSTLEINVEDTAILILEHESDVISEVHLDFVQRASDRSLKIIGSEGTLRCDFLNNTVTYFSTRTNAWTEVFHMAAFDINNTYIGEMTHFIRCLEGKDTPLCDINQGVEVLRIILAAYLSSTTAMVAKTKEVYL